MSEQQHKHVLLVEDDPIDIEAATRILTNAKKSYKVSAANRLDRACEILGEQAVDVIVLDLGLPDGAGIESVRTIRKCTDVPIVVLTTWDNVFAGKITDAGANAYLSKAEIGKGGLEEAIEKALAGLAITPSTAENQPANITIQDRTGDSHNGPSDLIDMVTQLRLCCSDLTLNHPELGNLDEIQAIARLAKQIHEKLR